MTAKGRQRLSNFGQALTRLTEALAVPPHEPLAIDGTVKRFEFTFELAWKTFKDALAVEGIEEGTPLSVLRAAARAGWIADEAAWLQILRDRNLAAHTYNETLALELYGRIRSNVATLTDAHTLLTGRYGPPRLL